MYQVCFTWVTIVKDGEEWEDGPDTTTNYKRLHFAGAV